MSDLPPEPGATPDPWAEWLLTKRHGGDSGHREVLRQALERIRDRVLDGAQLAGAGTLLDLGCGDGLIGLGALERPGAPGRVIFYDISASLLAVCEVQVVARNWGDRADFRLGSADRLSGIADLSIDRVTARACLTYVQAKAAAVREIHRVLAPGGRVSIGEPIFRDPSLQISQVLAVLAARPPDRETEHLRLMMQWRGAQFPSNRDEILASPLTNFSEWDLVRLFQEAGFSEIHLELHIDVQASPAMPWETFLDIAPHPLAPTLREVMRDRFTADEAARFESVLRPSVEAGGEYERNAIAYLTAAKTG